MNINHNQVVLLTSLVLVMFSNFVNASVVCKMPSDYYYDEKLEARFVNIASKNNPPQRLFSYFSSKDNITHFNRENKAKFFPNGEIYIYLPYYALSYLYEPIDFMLFKSTTLRHGYIPGYMINAEFIQHFNEEFNTRHNPSLVALDNQSVILRDNFSFGLMGITTHQYNDVNAKFIRGLGVIRLKNTTMRFILMSRKYESEDDVLKFKIDFEVLMDSFRNCDSYGNEQKLFASNIEIVGEPEELEQINNISENQTNLNSDLLPLMIDQFLEVSSYLRPSEPDTLNDSEQPIDSQNTVNNTEEVEEEQEEEGEEEGGGEMSF